MFIQKCIVRNRLWITISVILVFLQTLCFDDLFLNRVLAEKSDATAQRVLVVLGASGEVDYGEQFRVWGNRWKDAFADGTVDVIDGTILSPNSEDARSDRQKMLDWIAKANSIDTGVAGTYWLVLIGHGTSDRSGTKFNLRGPDISDG
jgi:hypothetical protein